MEHKIKQIQKIICNTINDCIFDKSINLKRIVKLIEDPYEFKSSNPTDIGDACDSNHGETMYQREIYDNNPIWMNNGEEWLDMELFVGLEGGAGTRLDLIGQKNGHFVICELKVPKKGRSGQPLEAFLQVISYYIMILNNYVDLDKCGTNHHDNARKSFLWKDIALDTNIELQVRAPYEFWVNWESESYSNKDGVQKNKAARLIIDRCQEIGLNVNYIVDNSICK